MSNHVIYIKDGELKAQTILDKEAFKQFVEALPVESILFKDGVVTTQVLTKEQKEVFDIFFKSMRKSWDVTQILVPAMPSKFEVKEEGINLKVEDKPLQKKSGRKKVDK